MTSTVNIVTITACLLAFGVGHASAQEYCVECTEPSATYRCVPTDARPGLSQSLQLACIKQLATEGGHGQCSVKRNVTVFECNAPVKRISVAAPAADERASSPVAAVPPVAAPTPAPADAGPPATVAEAMKRAKASSDRQFAETNAKLKGAGEQTGRFFGRMFSCVGSLFKNCGSDPKPE